ncbi:hypothetical protein DPEC_G00149980 [Dallia pectoralis]|uniref:Uncharacterized protein n=1 Tax=Dallia pectoralis TaxID=75939 RepID=A0ACC2GJ17_DALPE|nr:hypothetical protein DPEC_G00149980 [Dallia pectoralis]
MPHPIPPLAEPGSQTGPECLDGNTNHSARGRRDATQSSIPPQKPGQCLVILHRRRGTPGSHPNCPSRGCHGRHCTAMQCLRSLCHSVQFHYALCLSSPSLCLTSSHFLALL